MERVIRGVLWQRILDNRSMETAWLSEHAGGYAISGAIAGSHEDEPLEVSYRVDCDRSWSSRSVFVRQKRARDERSLVLDIDEHGHVTINGDPRIDLAGCTDIDLGVTPSTNALPINRMALAVGEEREIRAAWIRFPDLDVVLARQHYARIAELTYVYTSITSGFRAAIHVDRFGLPQLYEGIWSCAAQWG